MISRDIGFDQCLRPLIDAAARCFEYYENHGVLAEWSLHERGFRLMMSHGADRVERLVGYDDFKQAPSANRLLQMAEHNALQGLSL